MPTVKAAVPDTLRPYLFHGVDLNWKDGEKSAKGECPFCGRQKFVVEIETGRYVCPVCVTGNDKGGGNPTIFIRKLWEASPETGDLSELVRDKSLMNADGLKAWGVRKSPTGHYIVPGYSAEGTLNQLYKYVLVDGKKRLLPTPTLGHQLHGVSTYDPAKDIVYLCEGPWDGIAWYEALARIKATDDGYAPTSNAERSLLGEANVLAVPGCETFFDGWLKLFAGKTVVLMYDSDHPREHPNTGALLEPAGWKGLRRVAGILLAAKTPPKEVKYLRWGPEGYAETLPSGFDVRDILTRGIENPATVPLGTLGSRLTGVSTIFGRILPFDSGAALKATASKSTRVKDKDEMSLLPCDSYRVLVNSWRKAMKWTDGLDHALAVMLASVTSTKSVGDQLWVKVIGPASCGKSTLCEALSTAKDYVLAKSTVRGFHSGYRETNDEGEDNSLIAQVAGKTLVTKDGDTLLQAPNLPQILSEARDVYDTVSRTSYRNKASKDYAGIRMTWLLCGTSSLRSIDSSELGERFLDCVIMEGIDDELEDEILWRVANRADRNLSIESDGKAETHQEPEMTACMQLTGGYVCYLRENATRILGNIEMDDVAKRLCTRLGKFVAFMRARPSTRQDESAEREFAARLVSQHIRLSKCLAAVLNRKTVDEEIQRRTRRVAMDTARGHSLNIAHHLYALGDKGDQVQKIAAYVHLNEDKTRIMLRFLRQIGVLDLITPNDIKGVKQKPVWKLSERFRTLYTDVMDLKGPDA